jgi:pimeloyl-ACP methyl ester carboxylesterase
MSVSAELGERRIVELPAGVLEYRVSGAGRPLVFVHGVGVNGDLWRRVAPRLASDCQCFVPDWPLGSHLYPVRDQADLALPGLARIVADFLATMDLDGVTIVANDTGGAIAQALVGNHPERIGGLVLTSCDAFDRFPPVPQRYLEWAARSKLLMWLLGQAVRFEFVQRMPIAYGWVTSRPIEPAIMRSYTEPVRINSKVRNDFARLLRAVDTRFMFEAATKLRDFDKPALVLWAENDQIFPLEHGRRLAELLPRGRFEVIPDSRTFIPEEQPERLAAAVRMFVAGL